MTVHTDITQADWIKFVRFAVHGKKGQTHRKLDFWLVCVGVGVVGGVTLAFGGVILHMPSFLAGIISGTLSLVILARLRTRRSISDGFILGPRQVTLSDEGLRESSSLYEWLVYWPAVRGVQITEEHVFVMLDRSAAIIIPRRAFLSDSEREQFVSEVQRRSSHLKT